MRVRNLLSAPACQGCGASDHEGLCESCGEAVMRVHDGEHETACACADCGVWMRAVERLSAGLTLRTAREVTS